MKKFVLTILMGLLSFMTISFATPVAHQSQDDRCQIDSSVVNANVCVLSDAVLDSARTDKDYRTGCVYDTCSNANIVANAVFYDPVLVTPVICILILVIVIVNF